LLLAATVVGMGVMTLAPAQSVSLAPSPAPQADLAATQRLIKQLASPKFAQREAAAKELRRIGEPALAPLREAARGDEGLEVQRRAEQVAHSIMDDVIQRLLREEARESEIYHRKIAKLLQRVTDLGSERFATSPSRTPGDVPYLMEASLRLARARQKLGEFTAAANAYQQAESYCKDSRKIQAIMRESLAALMPIWEKAVQDQVARDPALKALDKRYPVVLLHSRGYVSGGSYQQCAYSFLYETADERTHNNDVQLQFDNGRSDRTFIVNMLTDQKNTVADLGNMDFTKDPSRTAADFEGPDKNTHEAIKGHVYLEKVEDANGNRFFVLFKVVAVDEQSRYMAFVWRRLPGGKIVRRN
jgi:hypothetical protein